LTIPKRSSNQHETINPPKNLAILSGDEATDELMCSKITANIRQVKRLREGERGLESSQPAYHTRLRAKNAEALHLKDHFSTLPGKPVVSRDHLPSLRNGHLASKFALQWEITDLPIGEPSVGKFLPCRTSIVLGLNEASLLGEAGESVPGGRGLAGERGEADTGTHPKCRSWERGERQFSHVTEILWQ
jgi:hypothetical protein